MGRLQHLFWLIVTCLPGLVEPAIAKRLALVIGNGKYQNVPPLRNPSNDATLMAASLEKVGFDVTLLKDQDQRAMKQALLVFGRKLNRVWMPGLSTMQVMALRLSTPCDLGRSSTQFHKLRQLFQ